MACKSVASRIKPWLLNSKGYSFSDVDVNIRLHLNESPIPPPKHVLEYVAEVLRYGNLYINSKLFREFRELIADYVGVDVENVFPYAGGDSALRAVFHGLLGPGDSALLLQPTYGMFDVFTSTRGLKKDVVNLEECGDWWCLDLTELIIKAKDADLVVVDDPNNPTGSPILKGDLKLISELAKTVKGFLLIDETYFEFSGYTAVPLIRGHPNIIISRSMSKAFSLAGFRLGYLVSSPEVIGALSKEYTPFDIPLPSLAAGVAALRDPSYVKTVVDIVKRNRDLMIKELRGLGIRSYNSLTNFILIRDSRDLRSLLLRHGIAIKTVGEDLYRVSVGSEEQCTKFLKVLSVGDQV